MTAIHEIQQVLWVNTPHGDGIALFIIDYGMQENTVWIVSLEKDGKILHYNSSQITLCKNHTIEFNIKKNKIQENNMTVIKHYTAEWCSPCRSLKPIIQQIVNENPSVNYSLIDIDANMQEAKDHGIKSIPVVVIEKNGIETARFTGVQSKSIYEQAIK